MNKEERNRAIEQIQSDVEDIKRDIAWIIQYLLKQNQPIQPPPYVPTIPNPFDPALPTVPWQPVTRQSCPKCGIRLDGVMGYVCGDTNCPTFFKVTC